MTFNEWLYKRYGQYWQGIDDDWHTEGISKEEYEQRLENLKEDYQEECESNNWNISIDI